MPATAPMPDPRVDAVAAFLADVDVGELALWDDLDVLSTHTRIEGVEVPAEGIVVGPGNAFTAVMNLYVSLQYGRDDVEGFSTADSFLAQIEGHFDHDTPVIDASSVDTSAFYE